MQEHERIEALKTMAAQRGNRWLSIGARHYEAMCGLDVSSPATEEGKQHRTNGARMLNVETAMTCIQALAHGADSELATLALIVREHVAPEARVAFDALYATAPIVLGEQVHVKRDGLHHVLQRLCQRLDIDIGIADSDPMLRLDDVEDCRPIGLEDGRVVVWLTEDASPHELFARAHAAAEAVLELRAAIEKVVAARDRWAEALADVTPKGVQVADVNPPKSTGVLGQPQGKAREALADVQEQAREALGNSDGQKGV